MVGKWHIMVKRDKKCPGPKWAMRRSTWIASAWGRQGVISLLINPSIYQHTTECQFQKFFSQMCHEKLLLPVRAPYSLYKEKQRYDLTLKSSVGAEEWMQEDRIWPQMCDSPLSSTWLLGSVRFVFCLSALLKQLNVKVARGLCCAAVGFLARSVAL